MEIEVSAPNPGRVFWITGLSGAGKSTIGAALWHYLRNKNITSNPVLLDGDALRLVFGNRGGYSSSSRRELAHQYSRLCKLLSDQGSWVVCCTISMFDDVRELNRQTIPKYVEIYLNVPMETLIQRDQKGLYSGALKGDVADVLGINADYEEPKSPDLCVNNDNGEPPEAVVAKLITKLDEKGYLDEN